MTQKLVNMYLILINTGIIGKVFPGIIFEFLSYIKLKGSIIVIITNVVFLVYMYNFIC